MSGLAVLLGRRLTRRSRQQVENALADPVCWPPTGLLREQATAAWPQEPPRLSVGDTLVVTVHANGSRAALWRAGQARSGTVSRPLDDEATAAWTRAAKQARQHMPAVVTKALRARPPEPPTSVRLVAQDGAGFDSVIQGDSLGLAACLSEASRLADRPLPPGLVGLAAIDDEGKLLPVRGLFTGKLDVLCAWGLAVDELLVASTQEEAVRAWLAERGHPARVTGHGTLKELLHHVFGSGEALLATSLPDTRAQEKAATTLFGLALRTEPPRVPWETVTRTAGALQQLCSEADPRVAWMLGIAKAVSARHTGDAGIPLDLRHPAFRTRPQQIQDALIAQALQHDADGGTVLGETVSALASSSRHRLFANPELGEDQLALLGALGRHYSRHQDIEEALSCLERATDGWRTLHKPEKSSHPLCEWIRLLGLHGSIPALEEVEEEVAGDVAQHCSPVSRRYIDYALARAHLQLGNVQTALERLGDTDAPWSGEETPIHVRCGAARWRAVAFAQLGRAEDAQQEREALRRVAVAHGSPLADGFVQLAILDTLLEAREDPADQVACICAHPFLRDHVPGLGPEDGDRASAIAREFPY